MNGARVVPFTVGRATAAPPVPLKLRGQVQDTPSLFTKLVTLKAHSPNAAAFIEELIDRALRHVDGDEGA